MKQWGGAELGRMQRVPNCSNETYCLKEEKSFQNFTPPSCRTYIKGQDQDLL